MVVVCFWGCAPNHFYLTPHSYPLYPELTYSLRVVYQVELDHSAGQASWEDAGPSSSSRVSLIANNALQRVCQSSIGFSFKEAIEVPSVTKEVISQHGADAGVKVRLSEAWLEAGQSVAGFSVQCLVEVMDTSGVKAALPVFHAGAIFPIRRSADSVLTDVSHMLENGIRARLFSAEILQRKAEFQAADSAQSILDRANRYARALYRIGDWETGKIRLRSADSSVLEAIYLTPESSIRLSFLHRCSIYGDNALAMKLAQENIRNIVLRNREYLCVELKGEDRLFAKKWGVLREEGGNGRTEATGYFKDMLAAPAWSGGKREYHANIIAYFDHREREATPSFLLVSEADTIRLEPQF
jgi:hypothetical protein